MQLSVHLLYSSSVTAGLRGEARPGLFLVRNCPGKFVLKLVSRRGEKKKKKDPHVLLMLWHL